MDPINENGVRITEPAVTEAGDVSVDVGVNRTSEEGFNYVRLWPFLKAIQERDWKGVHDFISGHPTALTSQIEGQDTVYHAISRKFDAPTWLIEKFASMFTPELMEQLYNESSEPPMFHGILYGNIKLVKALVRWNQHLPNRRNKEGFLPIHKAAEFGFRELIQYLMSVTSAALDDEKGVNMLKNLINSGHYGIAFDLMKRYPKLARERIQDRKSILLTLASRPLAFESGSRFGFLKRLIYKWISVQEPILSPEIDNVDMESGVARPKKLNRFTYFRCVLCQKLNGMLSNVVMLLVPGIKCLRDKKLMHIQSVEIVRMMCHEDVIWNPNDANNILWPTLREATKMGIYEIVNEILKAYYACQCFRHKEKNIIHFAILHRQEKIFGLLNEMNIIQWHWKTAVKEGQAENILHLAAKLASSSQIPGAALQMQRELQWFKVVESYVHPTLQEHKNNEDKTPREVFTKEHENLVKEGEKWMKETAKSCTVVGALIITIMFAAAFTVPGDNNTEGIPIFLHEPSFIVFIISDTLALFSSTASVLMFLGILTSRYSEQDFLKSLPKKLIIGLITLFFSIASMTIAFAATIYIALFRQWKWVFIPITLLGCLPVVLYALLQFPLLVEIYLSTYRSSVFQVFSINRDKMKEINEQSMMEKDSRMNYGFLKASVCHPRSSKQNKLLERLDRLEQSSQQLQESYTKLQESFTQLLNQMKNSSSTTVASSSRHFDSSSI